MSSELQTTNKCRMMVITLAGAVVTSSIIENSEGQAMNFELITGGEDGDNTGRCDNYDLG